MRQSTVVHMESDSPMALERELQAYRKELPKLLDRQGKFALFFGDSLAGVWDTYEDALQAGYDKLGLQPFLVKQVSATEQVHSVTRDVEFPCRI
jgi:hypothetical protein